MKYADGTFTGTTYLIISDEFLKRTDASKNESGGSAWRRVPNFKVRA